MEAVMEVFQVSLVYFILSCFIYWNDCELSNYVKDYQFWTRTVLIEQNKRPLIERELPKITKKPKRRKKDIRSIEKKKKKHKDEIPDGTMTFQKCTNHWLVKINNS